MPPTNRRSSDPRALQGQVGKARQIRIDSALDARTINTAPWRSHGWIQKGNTGNKAMHLALYKALRSINISDEAATAVVNEMDAHIDSRVTQATRPVLDKLDAVQGVLTAKIDAFGQVKAETEQARERRSLLTRWVVGTTIAAVAATLGILKALGLL